MLSAVAMDTLNSAVFEAVDLARKRRVAEGYAALCSARAHAFSRATDEPWENELRHRWDDVIRRYVRQYLAGGA